MPKPRTPHGDLARDLHDPEFARLYGAEAAKTELGIEIALARVGVGLSLPEMAQKLNISPQRLRKIEMSDANPSIGEIGAWLAVLGYTIRIGLVAIERTEK